MVLDDSKPLPEMMLVYPQRSPVGYGYGMCRYGIAGCEYMLGRSVSVCFETKHAICNETVYCAENIRKI